MKKYLILLLVIVPTSIYAEIYTTKMDCSSLANPDAPPFTVKFNGNFVFLILKGNSFSIPFSRIYVDRDADKWEVYENAILRVSTTIPQGNVTVIGSDSTGQYNVLTHGTCK